MSGSWFQKKVYLDRGEVVGPAMLYLYIPFEHNSVQRKADMKIFELVKDRLHFSLYYS